MRKNATCIVATALSLVLLFSPAAVNELLAAGDDTIGYTITSADSPLILNGNNIHTTYTSQRGLMLTDYGVAEMTGGTIKTEGFEAHAAWASGNSSVTLTDVKIEVMDSYTKAIQADSGSRITMNGGSVSTVGNFSTAFYIENSTVNLTDVAISTTGVAAGGVYAAYSDTVVTINGGSITTLHRDYPDGSNANNGAYGVTARYGAVVNLNGVTISTDKLYTGNVPSTGASYLGSHGIYAQPYSTINMTGGSIDTNTANNSHGVYSNSSTQENARVSISGTTVTTGGAGSYGLFSAGKNAYISADNISVTTSGGGSHGIIANGPNAYVGAENVSVYTSGNESVGVITGSNATAYLKNASIEAAGRNTSAVYANGANSLIWLNGAAISADNTKNAEAIYARGNSTGKAYVLAEEAVYNIHGLIQAVENSSIDITMADGSVFTGYTNTWTGLDATQNLRINGSNSVWNVSQDSVLTNLTLDGGSTINFYAADKLGTAVRTGNLNDGTVPSGIPTIPAGGIFIMKADIERELADNLIVGDTANGSHYITVAPDAKASTTGKELTTLVVVEGQDNSTFALTSKTVDAGAWTYALRQRTNALYDGITVPAIWELYAVGASDPGSDAVNTFYGAYLLGYAETNTLIQRLGDLRATPHEDGLWFRVHGGKFETRAKNYVKGFDMDYGGVHVGYDRKLENIGWDGDAYAGVYAGYTRGELDYTSHGDATIDSKMIGAYATFIKPNGFFLDAIIKYHWMENEFNSFDSAGDHVTAGDVNTGGLGFSVEVGQRIPFGREQKTGWYMEPQVQLTYQRYGDGTYECINGLRVSVDGFTSILGRLGALIGYETEKSNLYAKIARIREFDGEVNAVLNNSHIREDFSGSWWVYGIGYTSRLNEKNSIYMDIERTSGASFKQEWSARAGWRVVF